MPRVEELLDCPGSSHFMITSWSLLTWQRDNGRFVSEHCMDRPETAFTAPYGLFQFKVMHFKLNGAPATFQRMMDRVTHSISGTSGQFNFICSPLFISLLLIENHKTSPLWPHLWPLCKPWTPLDSSHSHHFPSLDILIWKNCSFFGFLSGIHILISAKSVFRNCSVIIVSNNSCKLTTRSLYDPSFLLVVVWNHWRYVSVWSIVSFTAS